jgi:hypothetical protein
MGPCNPIGSGYTIQPGAIYSAGITLGSWIFASLSTFGGWAANEGSRSDTSILFDTRWCGPGGAGQPVNGLDEACQAHDACYDAIVAHISDNNNPNFANKAGLQACNQQLCDSASHSNDIGSGQAIWYFSHYGLYKCH